MNKKFLFIIGLVLCVSLMVSACGHKAPPRPPEEMAMAPQCGEETCYSRGKEGLTFAVLTGGLLKNGKARSASIVLEMPILSSTDFPVCAHRQESLCYYLFILNWKTIFTTGNCHTELVEV